MTFRSSGICRLFDNIFQSVRGGVIQRYGIDPYSHFNLLYTFGRHAALSGKNYRPHHAIISEIHRAKRSIKLVLFLIGELRGEYQDSVIDALIHAKRRGVDVRVILSGHLARQGSPGKEYSLPIRLSPTATSGSVRPCSWTFTSVAIFGSHNRSQSSSDFFPTTRPAPPTWRRLAGATGLFAPIVRRRESRSASQIVLASCAAASAAVTPD